MKIATIQVQNFKAFYSKDGYGYEYIFDFLGEDGRAKNILIYGENGSGKSSLYWVLHHVLTLSHENILQKYKNVFAKKDEQPMKIEMTFDNHQKFIYNENIGIDIDNNLKEEFQRLTKIKTFLTYESIFLINELFTKKTSIERFIHILKILYGESLGEKIDRYNSLRKKFKQELQKKLCDFKELFKSFDEEHYIQNFWDNVLDDYEDIPKWDKEENKPLTPFYETIYYIPDSLLSELNNIQSKLEILQNEFVLQSNELDTFLNTIDDIKEVFEEKSESYYHRLMEEEKIFVTDFEPIETIEQIETINSYFQDIFEIVDKYQTAQNLSKEINDDLNRKVEIQIHFINELLEKYFKSNIKIDFHPVDYLQFNINNLDKFEPLRYKMSIADEDLPHRYTKFLNEAKISSINLAFYIAIIKTYAELRELKLLILDDLLISLDMSNRDIVLEILRDYFSNFQIIFLTHDKAFFEIAKQKFNYMQKNTWKYFEMYVDRDCDNNIEIPYIKEYGEKYTYIDRAKEHFNDKDYPACANYLRKEVERQFDIFLDIDKLDEKIKLAKLKENEHIIFDIQKDLKKLLKVLQQFRHCEKIPTNIQAQKCKEFSEQVIKTISSLHNYIEEKMHFEEFEDVKLILKSILHPQSHDDYFKPLYKRELEKSIEIIEEFKKILLNHKKQL
ncbi:hypothetical protein [Nitratiruptor tergarcus]|uniref:RecF/RecN/SMC N terminal domain-containing protein n=1 Tax=Nitratiruptor tergarcus DSM 16512 TaxID=1069081 RepID=A0A1W1WRC3_9BACT|nr:hypothetical protein [Nitratiruptor tergarcus]SMC08796.1 hypothetical protein SAMN05660197_0564 [Nitratiruptor tergarcus DSM 16512]